MIWSSVTSAWSLFGVVSVITNVHYDGVAFSSATFERPIGARVVNVPVSTYCSGADFSYQKYSWSEEFFSWTRDDAEPLDFSGYEAVGSSTNGNVTIPGFTLEANYVAITTGYTVRTDRTKTFYRPDTSSTKFVSRGIRFDFGRYYEITMTPEPGPGSTP